MLYVELAIVVVLMLINGVLAMAELAVVSSRRARLQALVAKDVIGSRRALALGVEPRQIPLDRADRHHAGRRAVGRVRRLSRL